MTADRPAKISRKRTGGNPGLKQRRPRPQVTEAGPSIRIPGPSAPKQPDLRQPQKIPSTSPTPPTDPPLASQTASADIAKFFADYRVPPIKEFKHTTSKRTRGPKCFDMHLHKDLRLKEVVILHRLPEVLVLDCDSLADACQLGKNESIKTAASTNRLARNERDLVDLYLKDVSKIYSTVASGLAFKSPGWRPVFEWTTQPKPDAAPRTEALADGFLSFSSRRGHLPREHLDDIELLEKHNFHHIVAWEFKSLIAGPASMAMFWDLEGEFQWTTCHERSADDAESPSTRCDAKTSRHRIHGRPVVTGRKAGPDSGLVARIVELVRGLQAQPRRQTHTRFSLIPDDPKNNQNLNDDRDNAHDVLQQSWTQAVVDDLTFFVISCGNEECIAMRDRENQRLYLSSLVRPATDFNPTHGKLHVALYMHAYFDALERAKLLELMLTTDPNAIPPRYRLKLDRGPLTEKQADIPSSSRRAIAAQRKRTNEEILQAFFQCNRVALRLHSVTLNPGATNLNVWDFRRQSRGPENAAQRTDENGNPQFFVDLEEKLDGKAYACYLARYRPDLPEQVEYLSDRLIMKMAKTDPEIEALKKEYGAYNICSELGIDSIVPIYGLFNSQVRPGQMCCVLFMADGGKSLFNYYSSDQRREHIAEHQTAYISAVKQFHYHHFVHNSMSAEHVLFDKLTTKVSVISLKGMKSLQECRQEDQDDSRFKEMKKQDLKSIRVALDHEIREPRRPAL